MQKCLRINVSHIILSSSQFYISNVQVMSISHYALQTVLLSIVNTPKFILGTKSII